MYSIQSANLGRTIWVIASDAERVQLLRDGVPESDIYTGGEISSMKGISLDGLKVVQKVKDIFPGAVFECFGVSDPTERRAVTAAPPQPPETVAEGASSKAEQLSLLT